MSCTYPLSDSQHGAGAADVHDSVSMSTRLDAIRSGYGVLVARSLMKIEASDANPSTSVFEMDGFISDSSYSAKKTTMVLFINGMCYVSHNFEKPSKPFPSKFEKPHTSNKKKKQRKSEYALTLLSLVWLSDN